MELVEPKNITVKDGYGKEKTYILSKLPSVQAREIMAKYPVSNMPKFGSYEVSQETMIKLMSFVAIELPGGIKQRLDSEILINNHVNDWEALAHLEFAMLEYNCSFLRDGRISTSLEKFAQIALPKILETLIRSLGQLSQAEKQPSTN